MLILTAIVATTIMIAPVVLSSLDQRALVNNQIESDNPLGIGSNQYLAIANAEGYYQRAGVLPNSRTSIVHNVYWLVSTETGWLGLITFLLLLLRPLVVAFFCGWGNHKDSRGDLLIGIGIGLLVVYIHSFFEWIICAF